MPASPNAPHYYRTKGPRVRAIIKPRGAGKTTDVVDMLKKDDGLCLLVSSLVRHRQLEQEFPHLKGRVFSNPTMIRGREFRGIVIDNIEDYLPDLPLPLVGFTLSGEPA